MITFCVYTQLQYKFLRKMFWLNIFNKFFKFMFLQVLYNTFTVYFQFMFILISWNNLINLNEKNIQLLCKCTNNIFIHKVNERNIIKF